MYKSYLIMVCIAEVACQVLIIGGFQGLNTIMLHGLHQFLNFIFLAYCIFDFPAVNL